MIIHYIIKIYSGSTYYLCKIGDGCGASHGGLWSFGSIVKHLGKHKKCKPQKYICNNCPKRYGSENLAQFKSHLISCYRKDEENEEKKKKENKKRTKF